MSKHSKIQKKPQAEEQQKGEQSWLPHSGKEGIEKLLKINLFVMSATLVALCIVSQHKAYLAGEHKIVEVWYASAIAFALVYIMTFFVRKALGLISTGKL